MNPSQRPDSVEAADYLGVFRRRWWIVLGLALVGLIGAFGYVLVAPKIYEATAAVYVTPTGADQNSQLQNSRTGGVVNMDNEAQLVTSAAVASIAQHTLHSSNTPWQLSKQITVNVPANTQVLQITCSASTSVGATACANAFAAAYLQNRSASSVASVNAQLMHIATSMATLQKSMAALSTKLKSLPSGSATRINDLSTVASDKGRLHSLTVQQGTLNGEAANSSGGTIITHATPPGKPASPKKLLVLPSGLVVGLIMGLVVAFLVDRRDKRIHTPQDVERYLDLPVLLNLPAFGRQVAVASPRSRTGQAFTELAHAMGAALGEGNHVVVIAGTTVGPARSVVVANVAATLARTHSDVVLVCADLNGTLAPELLGVEDGGQGLAELVAGKATVRDVVHGPAGLPGLWVITPGADPSLAVYHMQHDTARALISQVRMDARYVIIEAQATEEGADTFGLGEFADAAIVTIETSRTDRVEAADCVRRLRQLRTPVLGAVVSPALTGRVGVRPPRQSQPRVGDGGDSMREMSAGTNRGVSPVPLDRPVHSRDGYSDRAGRASGG